VVAQCSATCPTAHIKRADHPKEGSPWNPLSPSLPASPAA
jgi:hypothetical protein